MSEVSGLPDVVTDAETLAVPDVAERLSIPKSSVHQLVREGKLLSYRVDGEVVVPADFLDGSEVVRGLPGTIVVMRDGGYDDDDILRWLFTHDDLLPGVPIAMIREGRHRAVKRRAQAMAF
ncbi:Rv2175c family DNA-binding protein [Pseudonocardia sediminis]|uniref:Rv2175c family DNA-binding protein n=1 Tax=Pseudonocardia sediminis TaxID=1397368 RepID=UPI001029C9BE|nr:Rv2175c family DNA-binding protein [Pseudonocardia sediminis]